MSGPVFFVLSPGGLELARRLQPEVPASEVHGWQARVPAADRSFVEAAEHLRGLFAAGRPIVACCATGIVVRALAPLLTDKRSEPPVVVLAEDGSAVVPLLGGHHGANDLARRLAAILGVPAAVTTAGDLRLGVALDAPPAGRRLANPEDAKAFAAALLSGERLAEGPVPGWLAGLPQAPEGRLSVVETERKAAGGPQRLIYHPQRLALGVGCARGCPPEELQALVDQALDESGLAREAIAAVVSIDLKADEPAVLALADRLGVPARFFDAATLVAETPRLANPSEAVFAEVGCHGVAEGAALAAAGPAGRLLATKRKSRNATCAVAAAPDPLQAGNLGRARGRLAVVGLGPGDEAWRTAEAGALIAGSRHLVGYRLYLDLLGAAAAGKVRHDYALGEEEVRVRAALALAAKGEDVALVCSGDPGIYAMATLVFELIERGEDPAWKRCEIVVAPGISAVQAAAARIGAPLGHDFCCVSLSDLLTPWPTIERRLRAAAEGDFVVAFYNPVSQRRRHQLPAAREILLRHRPPETPVLLASNLGRPAERLALTTLGNLTSEAVDMLTLVLVGSSQSRVVARGDGGAWLYTPRGYAAKQGRDDAA